MEEEKAPNITEKCQVCHKDPFKYKCPRCSLKTCCLACVKTHKETTKCTGIPDKVTFVDLKSFGMKQLHKDIGYITDVIDAVNRNSKKYAYQHTGPKIEGRLKQLRNICKNKRGCLLRIAPAIFAANQRNKSFYKRQEDSVYWTVGCCFVREDGELDYYFEEPISEKVKVGEVMEKFMDKAKYYGTDINELLSKYQPKEFANAKVFIKSVVRDKKEIKYKEVAQKQTLEEALKGEEIADFPKLFIVFNDVDVTKNKAFSGLLK